MKLSLKFRTSFGLTVAGIFSVSTLLTACKAATDPSSLDTDSQTSQPSYESIIKKMKDLSQQSDLVQVLTYGKTVDGQDLYMVRIGKPAAGNPDKPLVVFSEATHGNEYLGVGPGLAEGIVNNAKNGALDSFFQEKLGVMLIVPVVNVDGYEYHRQLPSHLKGGRDGSLDSGNSKGRRNKNNVDLNRDFSINAIGHKGFTQPETQAYANAVADQLKGGYKLTTTIDYHCCLGQGVLAYPYQYQTNARLSAEDLKRHLDVGAIMKLSLPSISVANGASSMGYYATGLSYDYFFEKYGAASFTYEGADGVDEGRVDQHVKAWTELLQAAAKNAPEQPSTTSSAQQIVVANDITLALGHSSGDSSAIAISAATGASALLCQGTLEECAKSDRKITAELNQLSARSGRTIFRQAAGEAGVSLQADQTYSVITKAYGSNIWRGTMVRFESAK